MKSCETAVLRELERRGIVYEAGSHNKYISDACYMMNRYGVPLDDCTAWALERFSDYNDEGNDVASIVRSCYLQTEEHGTTRAPRAESRYASIKDIQEWLRNNNIRIRHNLITRKREIQVESGKMTDDSCCRPDGNFPLCFSLRPATVGSSFNSQLIELTDPAINLRPVWERYALRRQHIASFCATGNNHFFLTDHTGNRRFLTFEVESIVPPQTYDYGYEGIYAQAYALWQQGFRYWFNDEENAEINRHNTDFEAPNKELELIQKYYRAPMEGEECKFLTATDILERINGGIKEQLSTVRIGIALRTMGIERIRSGNARGYRLVEISPEQISINQRALGSFTDVNDDENR